MTKREYEDFRITCGERVNRRPPEKVYVPRRRRILAEKRAAAWAQRFGSGSR